MAKANLSADRLREIVDYDPETGAFTWRAKTGKKPVVGQPAGSVKKDSGYLLIGIEGFQYRAQRLAWLHAYGVWPDGVVDHLNGDRLDNRLANLRDVPRAINNLNRHAPRAGSHSGLLGVSWHKKTQKWRAQLQISGVRHFLGVFDEPEKAQQAYAEARRRLHGCVTA